MIYNRILRILCWTRNSLSSRRISLSHHISSMSGIPEFGTPQQDGDFTFSRKKRRIDDRRRSTLRAGREAVRQSISNEKFHPSCTTAFHADIPIELSNQERFLRLIEESLKHGIRQVAVGKMHSRRDSNSNDSRMMNSNGYTAILDQFVRQFIENLRSKNGDRDVLFNSTTTGRQPHPENVDRLKALRVYNGIHERLNKEVERWIAIEESLNVCQTELEKKTTIAEETTAVTMAASVGTTALPQWLDVDQASFLSTRPDYSADARDLVHAREVVELQTDAIHRAIKVLHELQQVSVKLLTNQTELFAASSFPDMEYMDDPKLLIKGLLNTKNRQQTN